MPSSIDWKLILLILGALGWVFEKLWKSRGRSLNEVKDAHGEIKETQVDLTGRVKSLEETVRDTDNRLRDLSESVSEVRENAISQPDMDRLQERLGERIDSIKEDIGGRLDRLAESMSNSD